MANAPKAKIAKTAPKIAVVSPTSVASVRSAGKPSPNIGTVPPNKTLPNVLHPPFHKITPHSIRFPKPLAPLLLAGAAKASRPLRFYRYFFSSSFSSLDVGDFDAILFFSEM
jgi:hypothetical protein